MSENIKGFKLADEALQSALDMIDEAYRFALKVDSADGKQVRIELGEAVGLVIIAQKRLATLARNGE